jgi:hypothetical protein
VRIIGLFAFYLSPEREKAGRLTVVAGFVAASPSSSSFVLGGAKNNNNFTFSVNVANDSDDLYFRLEGPIGNSWIAVGAGDQMTGSLIFVVYAAQDNGSEAFLSPLLEFLFGRDYCG